METKELDESQFLARQAGYPASLIREIRGTYGDTKGIIFKWWEEPSEILVKKQVLKS